MAANRVHLPGSTRTAMAGASIARDADPDKVIDVTIYGTLQFHQANLPDPAEFSRDPPKSRQYMTENQVNELMSVDPDSMAQIHEFIESSGLQIDTRPECRRSVIARGPIGKFQEAFDTHLSIWQHKTDTYRGRSGPLSVPAHLRNKIQGVFGLDNRRVGHSYLRKALAPALGRSIASPHPFLPTDFVDLYNFPKAYDGTGQTIAVLAFNGAVGDTGVAVGGGFDEAVLQAFFKDKLNLTLPSISTVVVQGPGNKPDPSDPNDVSGEIMLDLTMIGSLAPGAKIVVYFSEFTEQGWVNVMNRIVQDQGPTIISCSYGNAETGLSADPQSIWSNGAIIHINQTFQFAALKGMTILCASGDNGSSDGERGSLAHADFPASSPWVTGCGGTRLVGKPGQIHETVWNDGPGSAGGGGISDLFPLPDYQQGASVPPSVNPGHVIGRGIPDVSGNGDPTTGVIVPQLQGDPQPIGGTSAVAPLWSALIARINQGIGTPVGFMNPYLYKNCASGVLNDVTAGNNGFYRAAKGWDCCTGLGTPDGEKLLKAF
ncbi:protease pro-enzyme activation domain-containing protein [Burkholderia ubonensis]|uniref:S53 family peptidase n=1 Tax=Burkholderia ubonensis TaxID=101571 RepID=UPI0007C6A814|nr:S53 family peptidase [Burkholderia ubonensis]